MTWVIMIVVMAALAFVIANAVAGSRSPLDAHERDELQRLRLLVDDLKDTAWDHRELDSPLSTIIIDKIRSHERRGRPELGD